jgi:hypothetical protein
LKGNSKIKFKKKKANKKFGRVRIKNYAKTPKAGSIVSDYADTLFDRNSNKSSAESPLNRRAKLKNNKKPRASNFKNMLHFSRSNILGEDLDSPTPRIIPKEKKPKNNYLNKSKIAKLKNHETKLGSMKAMSRRISVRGINSHKKVNNKFSSVKSINPQHNIVTQKLMEMKGIGRKSAFQKLSI